MATTEPTILDSAVTVAKEEATTTTQTGSDPGPVSDPIVILDTLTLRPWHISDIESLVREADDPLVGRLLGQGFPNPYRRSDAEWWINTGSRGDPLLNYAICDRASGAAIGGIGLKPVADLDPWTREVGYWLGRAHWGKGLMTEVTRAFAAWAFGRLPDLVRLEAGVYEGNTGSHRVLQKAGFTAEGTKRKAVVKEGRRLDIFIYGLLREELPGVGAK